jgi:ABC-type transport system involved in multi-copper enzyme maturation permease subunit
VRLFATFVKLEFKRLLTARNLTVGLLFSCAAVYFIINGIAYFKDAASGGKYAGTAERQKVADHGKHLRYENPGIETELIPAPLSVFFFNSGVFSRVSAVIKDSADLKIYRSLKGRDAFLEKNGVYSDYGGFLLFFGSLLLLFFGSETLRHGDYLKSLACMGGRGRVYAGLIAARFLLISLFFAGLTALGVGAALTGGIALTGADILSMAYFFMVWELAAFFFFITGAAVGVLKGKGTSSAAVLLLWIFLIYIVPTAFNQAVSARTGNFAPGCPLENRMRETASLYHSLAVTWPPAFYRSLLNELAGAGYENSIEFFKHARALKDKLGTLYKNKESRPGSDGASSFMEKGEPLLFHGESRLPPYFLPGVLAALGYCLALTLLSYRMFRRLLLHIPGADIKPYAAVNIELKKGEFKVLETGHRLADLLFSLFSGDFAALAKKGFAGSIRLDRMELAKAMKNDAPEFLYIHSAQAFPGDIIVEDFISLCAALVGWPPAKKKELLALPAIESIRRGRFNQLEPFQRGQVQLTLSRMKRASIYLFFDTALKMPHRFAVEFLKRMEELAKDGSAVVYVTSDSDLSAHGNHQNKEGGAFTENPFWARAVEVLREEYGSG